MGFLKQISKLKHRLLPLTSAALILFWSLKICCESKGKVSKLSFDLLFDLERHRRSKHEQEGRTFQCQCGKSYLSQPALNNHKKTKHPELVQDNIKRGRGRPRKYPQTTQADFESTKYESFFAASDSRKPTGQEVNAAAVAEAVFHFLYEGEYKEKMFSRPNSIEDNFILKNLKEGAELPQKQKSSKCCDEVFYEYLKEFKGSTNEKFFTLLTKFVILFRECYDISRNKEKAEKKAVTNEITPEGLPDLCNEFYGEFMEPNEFFGIKDAEEKNEIIEIIQHFCIWLFKNEYTKSKLSLAS